MYHSIKYFWAVGLLIFLSACAPQGVVRMSPAGQWGAVTDGNSLWVIARDGQKRELTADYLPYYGVVFSADGLTAVYVNTAGEVLRQSVTNGEPSAYPDLTVNPQSGALIPLPNSQFLLLDENAENGETTAQTVVIASGQVVAKIEGIGHIFGNTGAIQTRTRLDAENNTGWQVPDLPNGGVQLVFQAVDAPEFLYLFSSNDAGLTAQGTLPRQLSQADQELLEQRVLDDPRSGIFTQDAHYLLLHTSDGETYQLWALDLRSNAEARLLVADSPQPIRYWVNPNNSQVAYTLSDGQSEMVDLQSGVITALPAGVELLGWQ